jgi:hypothetical protein
LRRAVIGKAHRMHLAAPPRKPAVPVEKPSTAKPRNHVTETTPKRAAPAPPESDGEISAAPVTLIDLRNDTCRWPLAKFLDQAVFFCGAAGADLARKRPYCAAHTARARGRYSSEA